MRLVITSDTHSVLGLKEIPDGDVLLHAGDLTMGGTIVEISRQAAALGRLPHKRKLVVPGNHDFLFQKSPQLALEIMSPVCNILIDREIVIDGIKFYGSPWQPWFHDWAYNLPRMGEELQAVWEAIPEDTDVLITHGPPFGIMDQVPRGEYVGCELLLERVKELKNLRLHCFGHIHCGYGYEWKNGKLFVNGSYCNEQYYAANSPIVVDIDETTKECTLVV